MLHWLIPVDTAMAEAEADAFVERQGHRPVELPEEMAKADAVARAFVKCSEEHLASAKELRWPGRTTSATSRPDPTLKRRLGANATRHE